MLCVNRLSRLVLSPPTPTAGTDPSSEPLPVCAAAAELSVAVADEIAASVVAAEEMAASVVATSVWVDASTALCVNRLNRLVLSPPTPTAGTVPSSVPLPVWVANGLRLEDVSDATAACAGSVGACRLLGDRCDTECRPLAT